MFVMQAVSSIAVAVAKNKELIVAADAKKRDYWLLYPTQMATNNFMRKYMNDESSYKTYRNNLEL